MADESTEHEETTEVEETEESTTEEATEESAQEETGNQSGDNWETKARKRAITINTEREARRAAEKKVKEFEDANKSESEKLSEKATTAEGRAAEAEAKALRLEIAIDKGLTGKQARAFAKRLVGDTQEDLEEDAEELLASFKPATEDQETTEESDEDESEVKPEVKRRPVEKTKRTGATSRTEPEEMDPAKLADAIPSTGF